MMPKRDQITGGFIFILGVIVYTLTTSFSKPLSMTYPGPRMLPTIAAFGFIICGTGIFLTSTFKHSEEKAFMSKSGWLRIGLILTILAVYILSMKILGFLIITPICLYILVTLFSKGWKSSLIGRVVFSLVFTGIIYVLYSNVFGLTLPRSMFF